MPATTDKRRQRIIDFCLMLPEATYSSRTGQHQKFEVQGRTFAYHVDNEHGDGRVAIIVKVAPGEQELMARADAERYYVPKYIGHRGWVALRVDTRSVDWGEIESLLRASYRQVAPKRLSALAG
jgi:phosphoribosylglycinamide formyltransferase-1